MDIAVFGQYFTKPLLNFLASEIESAKGLLPNIPLAAVEFRVAATLGRKVVYYGNIGKAISATITSSLAPPTKSFGEVQQDHSPNTEVINERIQFKYKSSTCATVI